jgi:hypothetical protein
MPFIPPTPDDIARMLEVIHPRSRPPCSAPYRRHFRKQLRGFSRALRDGTTNNRYEKEDSPSFM